MIPVSEGSDPEPVRSSLARARADLERGQMRDALLHLRRAAESADDAGSELRAVALARAAADLATEVGSATTPPPASTAAVAPISTPAVASAALPVRSASSINGALQQLLDSGRAVKVVVKRSARDEGLYVVRRAEHQAPALGTREAVIVLLEPDDGFFNAESDLEPSASAPAVEHDHPYPTLAPADRDQK